ncbi:hypothetical protein [Pseudomonas putida]
MKKFDEVETESIVDVVCDVCGDSTTVASGEQEFGTLRASWGKGNPAHEGEVYEVDLCHHCFMVGLLALRDERRIQYMFSDENIWPDNDFGLVSKPSAS